MKSVAALLFFSAAVRRPVGSRCGESPDFAVPIVAIDAERAVTTEEIEGVIGRLGSPVIRGDDLLLRTGLVKRPDPVFVKAIQSLFAGAQDSFFSGRQEQADSDFAEIIQRAESNQVNRLSPQGVREIVFKSHIQRAVIARESGDETRVTGELSLAAEKFRDLEPTTREFPPWVCQRYDEIRREAVASENETVVETSGALNAKLLLRSTDLTIVPEGEPSLDLLAKDAVALARSGAWTRLVAVVGRGDAIEVWLVEVDFDGVLRKGSAPLGAADAVGIAAGPIVESEQASEEVDLKQAKRPWYKDALAWTLAGAGAAMIVSGFVLGNNWGSPSKEEPWAYTLIAAGGGMLAGGAVLFFVPPLPRVAGDGAQERAVAFGLTAAVAF